MSALLFCDPGNILQGWRADHSTEGRAVPAPSAQPCDLHDAETVRLGEAKGHMERGPERLTAVLLNFSDDVIGRIPSKYT